MALDDPLSLIGTAAALLTAFGLGAIVGFLFGARTVIRFVAEVLPLGKQFLGRGKMGMWDVVGSLIGGKIDLGGILGGLGGKK